MINLLDYGYAKQLQTKENEQRLQQTKLKMYK